MADQDVVDRFVQDGRLVIMPTKRAKRLSALRRYLVDEMFLTRDGGVYRRSGGTVRP